MQLSTKGLNVGRVVAVDTISRTGPRAVASLHQRTKERVLEEATDIAIRLFLEQGFEETTVDDLCAAMGMSRRSFFRYFKAKEDIVLLFLGDFAVQGCGRFTARPADEGLLPALRHSMDPFIEYVNAEPARTLALMRLIQGSPILRARYLDRLDRWRANLAMVIAERQGLPVADLSSTVIAAAGIGIFITVVQEWTGSEGTACLADLFDRAFQVLATTS